MCTALETIGDQLEIGNKIIQPATYIINVFLAKLWLSSQIFTQNDNIAGRLV